MIVAPIARKYDLLIDPTPAQTRRWVIVRNPRALSLLRDLCLVWIEDSKNWLIEIIIRDEM